MSKNNNGKQSVVFNVGDGTTYKLWRECPCGCGEVVQNVFAPGHDARYHGAENRLIAAGNKHPTEKQVQAEIRRTQKEGK